DVDRLGLDGDLAGLIAQALDLCAAALDRGVPLGLYLRLAGVVARGAVGMDTPPDGSDQQCEDAKLDPQQVGRDRRADALADHSGLPSTVTRSPGSTGIV